MAQAARPARGVRTSRAHGAANASLLHFLDDAAATGAAVLRSGAGSFDRLPGLDSLPSGRARWRSRRPCSPLRESRTLVGSAAALAPDSLGSVDPRACSLLVLRRDPILPFGAFAPMGPRNREAGCGPEELCSQPRPMRRRPAELVTSSGRCFGRPGPESPSMEKAPRVHDARGLLEARLIPPARGKPER